MLSSLLKRTLTGITRVLLVPRKAMSSCPPDSLGPEETGFLSVGAPQMHPLLKEATHRAFCDSPPTLRSSTLFKALHVLLVNLEFRISGNIADRNTRTFLTHLSHFLARIRPLVLPELLSCPFAVMASPPSTELCSRCAGGAS